MSRRIRLTVASLALVAVAGGLVCTWSADPVRPRESASKATESQRRHVARPRASSEAPSAPGTTARLGMAPTGATAPLGRVTPGRTLLLTDLPARTGAPDEIARALLDEYRAALGLQSMPGRLVHERSIDSLSGHHLRMRQVVGGVPVFGSRVSAHVGRDGRPLMLRADIYPLDGVRDRPDALVPRTSAHAARALVAEWLADSVDNTGDITAVSGAPDVREPELVVLPIGRTGVLTWSVGVQTADQTLRVFVDARDGAFLRADDLRIAAEGRGMVFDPNPIHSEGNGTLRDQNDRDVSVLTNARRLVTLPRLDGTGFLRGQWVDLTDSPVSAFDRDLDWTWATRSHHVFEQVNCYYHLDRAQARLQALGFTNVNAERQDVDAHASSADQSIYNVLDDRLEFGDGGVDDGEDADVVIHEYGHAMQFDQVGTFGLTGEGGAMGEGFGDFLAVLFHESGRSAWDVLFASWDASSFVNQNPPFLRRVDRNKVFPTDIERQVHADGEIWSRFLWDLRQLVGADDALRLVVESHFLLTPNARFRDGVNALIVANIALRDSRDDASIRTLMTQRGLPFDVPSAPLPPEEDSEDNDTAEQAAPLERGLHERFLLADEDWFRVVVPPFRRVLVRAEFDAAAMDMDLETYTETGVRSAVSAEAGGVEELEVTAGPTPIVALIRGFHAPGSAQLPGAYDITITETALESMGPIQNFVRSVEPGQVWAFRVAVSPAKVDDQAKLRVKSRRQRRGAKTDLQLFNPESVEVVDAATARRKKGGKAAFSVNAPGDWLVVVTPREGHDGRVRIKIKLK